MEDFSNLKNYYITIYVLYNKRLYVRKRHIYPNSKLLLKE